MWRRAINRWKGPGGSVPALPRCRKIALYPDYNYSDTKWKAIDMYAIGDWENVVVGADFVWAEVDFIDAIQDQDT